MIRVLWTAALQTCVSLVKSSRLLWRPLKRLHRSVYIILILEHAKCFQFLSQLDVCVHRLNSFPQVFGWGSSWYVGRRAPHPGISSRSFLSTWWVKIETSPSVSPSCHRYLLSSFCGDGIFHTLTYKVVSVETWVRSNRLSVTFQRICPIHKCQRVSLNGNRTNGE